MPRMKSILLCVVVVVLSSPLYTQTLESPDASGNAFVRVCSAMDKAEKSQIEILQTVSCVFYVNGFADGVDTNGWEVMLSPGEVERFYNTSVTPA